MIRSYVVPHDYGFAPNPFGGVLTLACCKPKIRSSARVGDWIVGTTPVKLGWRRLCFAGRVSETLTFDDYFYDDRFSAKRPTADNCGDAIYRAGPIGTLELQRNRFHGSESIAHDTSVDRVLVCTRFWYFGDHEAYLPEELAEAIVKRGPGHRNCSDPEVVASLEGFFSQFPPGLLGEPRMEPKRLRITGAR